MNANANSRRNRTSSRRPTARLLAVEQRQLGVLNSLHEITKSTQKGLMERVPDVPRVVLKRDKVFSFIRLTNTNVVLANSTTAPIGYAFAPSLVNFPNSTDFTNLFEQWRILQCTFTFMPLYSGSLANPLYTWIDYDDDTTPVGLAEAQQAPTLRISPSGQYVERTITPNASLGGFATGSISGYGSMSSRIWMDDSSPSNRFYGLKALIPTNTNISNGVPLYSVEVSALIQCRRPR